MLKKKSGKFAPKVIRRHGVSSEPSSARPSVERQSQTPAPAAQPEECTSSLPRETPQAPAEEQSVELRQTQPPPPDVPSTTENAPLGQTSAPEHADAAAAHRDSPIPDPIPEIQSHQLPTPEQLQNKSRIADEAMAEELQPDATSTASRKNLKRKARDEEPPQSDHVQKRRVIEAQSVTPLSEAAEPPRTNAALAAAVEQSETTPAFSEQLGLEATLSDIGLAGGEPPSDLRVAGESIGERTGDGSVTESSQPYLGPAGDVGSGEGQAVQVSQLVPVAALNPDGTTGYAPEEPASGAETPNKKATKRKKIQAAQDGDDVRATIDMQINRPRRVTGTKRSRKKKDGDRRKKIRAMTPEGAEDDVVDHSTMKMADLCRDLRIGKKFSKHDEIKQRVVQKKVKAKLVNTHPELITLAEGEAQAGEDSQAQTDREAEASEPAASVIPSGPQMRVVDGQIVLDDSSLQIDRHKRAQAENIEMEEVEENEFTRITTSGTFMKRERAQLWDHAATDMFYRGLRMFGTDFEMIAKMFPHRNRRQIKLKFNKEERNNLTKINRALMVEKDSIDLDEYQVMTGLKFEEVADIEAERDTIEAEQVAEQEKHAAEIAETARKKKADIQAKSDAAKRILATADEPTGDSAKENEQIGSAREASATAKGKKKTALKRKKKNPHSSRGGEEVEVLGTIET
jgi:transcription factor TFIIIB component B''